MPARYGLIRQCRAFYKFPERFFPGWKISSSLLAGLRNCRSFSVTFRMTSSINASVSSAVVIAVVSSTLTTEFFEQWLRQYQYMESGSVNDDDFLEQSLCNHVELYRSSTIAVVCADFNQFVIEQRNHYRFNDCKFRFQ